MTGPSRTIGRATPDDLDGILALQDANQIEHGGMLSARFSRSRIEQTMRDMPLIVARSDARVIGFLMTSTRAMGAGTPVIDAMLDTYPGAPDAYVYGPVCVDSTERGRGLAAAMFNELRCWVSGREGVLFIRADNTASLSVHRHMGMREVAKFTLGAARFVVFSCIA